MYKEKTEVSRDVLLEGALNFRDYGGYKTSGGRTVKWGIFYRSAEMSRLTDKDIQVISNLGIKTIIDYRSLGEIENQPNKEIPLVKTIQISAMDMDPNLAKSANLKEIMKLPVTVEALKEIADLEKVYCKIVFGNDAFKKLLELLENPDHVPILHHCTAGKDRTGVGSALVLLLLGVPEETVLADYLLTNERFRPMQALVEEQISSHIKDEAVRVFLKEMMSASDRFLLAMLSEIKSRYETYGQFFLEEYGITEEKRKRLQDLFLTE